MDMKKLDLKGFILVELVVVIASGGGFFVFKKVQEEVKPIRILAYTISRQYNKYIEAVSINEKS